MTQIEELWNDAQSDEEHKMINGALLIHEATRICTSCGASIPKHIDGCQCPSCGTIDCEG